MQENINNHKQLDSINVSIWVRMATEKEYFKKINAINPNQRLCGLCFKLSLLERLLVHMRLSLRPHSTPDALGGAWCLRTDPLQLHKASLSLGRVASACCLTISKEWSYWKSCCQQQHSCTNRTERTKSCSTLWMWCVYSEFYTRLAWEVWRVPHKNRSNRNFFVFFVSLTSLELKPHTTLTDSPLVPGSAAAIRHVSGLWATSRIRTNVLVTQAGQSSHWVGASELQSAAEGTLLQLNHLIRSRWLHQASSSPLTRTERPHQTWWLTVE